VDGKVSAVVAVNDLGVQSGFSAQELLRLALTQIDGKGGGKEAFAQGAGTNAAALPGAISSIEAALVAHQ
jgi:alanyl-tRNA synthetase